MHGLVGLITIKSSYLRAEGVFIMKKTTLFSLSLTIASSLASSLLASHSGVERFPITIANFTSYQLKVDGATISPFMQDSSEGQRGSVWVSNNTQFLPIQLVDFTFGKVYSTVKIKLPNNLKANAVIEINNAGYGEIGARYKEEDEDQYYTGSNRKDLVVTSV